MGKRERNKKSKGIKRLFLAPAVGMLIYMTFILAFSIMIFNETIPEKLCTIWAAKISYFASASIITIWLTYGMGRGARNMAAAANALLWAAVAMAGVISNGEVRFSGIILTLSICIVVTLFIPTLLPQNSKMPKRR